MFEERIAELNGASQDAPNKKKLFCCGNSADTWDKPPYCIQANQTECISERPSEWRHQNYKEQL